MYSSRAIRRIREFIALPVGDKARILVATILLNILSISISILPFSRVRGVLLRLSTILTRIVPGEPSPAHIARTVDIVDRCVLGDRTCLVRSLSTEMLLALYGYAPRHVIGVSQNSKGELTAHSWLEYEGEILIGEQDDISEFEELPPLGRKGKQ